MTTNVENASHHRLFSLSNVVEIFHVNILEDAPCHAMVHPSYVNHCGECSKIVVQIELNCFSKN